jgi:hypothetical protein
MKPREPMKEWLVERAALGEATPSERSRIDEESIAAVERSNAEILNAHPPRVIAAQIRDRYQKQKANTDRALRPAMRVLAPFAAAAAAAIIAVMVLDPVPKVETIRMKGLAPHLLVHRKTAEGAETLGAGAEVRPHDVLQLGYVAAGRAYGAIVSLDGRGAVTMHLPRSDLGAASLREDGAIALDEAYELDDAPLFERFIFVTASTPFQASAVIEAAEKIARDRDRARVGPLDLPSGLEQTSIVLQKVRP